MNSKQWSIAVCLLCALLAPLPALADVVMPWLYWPAAFGILLIPFAAVVSVEAVVVVRKEKIHFWRAVTWISAANVASFFVGCVLFLVFEPGKLWRDPEQMSWDIGGLFFLLWLCSVAVEWPFFQMCLGKPRSWRRSLSISAIANACSYVLLFLLSYVWGTL